MNAILTGVGSQDAASAAADRKIAGADEKLKSKALQEKQLREIAQGFESIFMNMLMKSMRSTVKKSEFFSGGRGEEVFTNLMDMNVSDMASKQGRGLGIAEMIVKKYAKNLHAPDPETLKGTQLDTAPRGAAK